MDVELTRTAEKQLDKAPKHVTHKFVKWADMVKMMGVGWTRCQPGFHDEPLAGKRQGQRAIRLNLQWRAIYEETETGITITVMEVTPHDYRTR